MQSRGYQEAFYLTLVSWKWSIKPFDICCLSRSLKVKCLKIQNNKASLELPWLSVVCGWSLVMVTAAQDKEFRNKSFLFEWILWRRNQSDLNKYLCQKNVPGASWSQAGILRMLHPNPSRWLPAWEVMNWGKSSENSSGELHGSCCQSWWLSSLDTCWTHGWGHQST